ncbi:glutamate--cysteine ligase [Candidatus Marinamargulisbacteria bacterium SCGC AAA071-K20]|nr:glutamate--cysteine ligase [Candidatus Marinamargulisbacteria bacterium SCGC AAA071-K20]
MYKLIDEHKTKIEQWLHEKECCEVLPLYSSVDIRNAGFKNAVVDTNLFPAGFNNLCLLALKETSSFINKVILDRVSDCKRILLVMEEHTRNKFYLENIFVIKKMLVDAGFEVDIVSFCETEVFDEPVKELETSAGNNITVTCFKCILKKIEKQEYSADLVILNNDLSKGIPEMVTNMDIPIYPSLHAGWHARLKSHHFKEANALLTEFAEMIDEDPWKFLAYYESEDNVDVNEEADRKRLAVVVEDLLKKIQIKYDEYGIKDKPFVFLKSDSGTYGMGVVPVESVDEVLTLNRKLRNKLSTGKSSMKIDRFIIQEGVPTISSVDNKVSEVCVYQIANRFVGGFYRVNTKKGDRDNLNSSGMTFTKICEASDSCALKGDDSDDNCGVAPDENLDLSRLLARIAGVAAHREIKALETK